MANLEHALSVQVHLGAYVGAVAPDDATYGTGAIRAGILWVDTSGATPVLKKRNAGNTGWDTIVGPAAYYAIGGTDVAVADGGTGASTAGAARTNLGLAIGTNVEAWDADLDTIAGLTATTDNFLQAKSSAWASRTPTQVTADLIAVVGDSGSGGTKGLVPAPGAGDAAAGKFLKADGTFAVPAGGGGGGSMSSFTLAGDGGSSQTINDGNTLTVEGGVGLVTAAGATDKVTVDLDINSLTADASPDSAADYVATYDASASTHKKVLLSNLPGGGGGAPTTAPYVTTASDGTLSAEVVIPGLAGSPDIAGAAGAGFAEEYDSGSSGLTWSTSPAVEDVNTTAKSHLYLKATTALSDALGYKAWAPAGDFDIRAKLEVGHDTADAGRSLGFVVMNSANTVRLMLQFTSGSGGQVQAYTYSGSYSLVGSALAYGAFGDVYLRIVRISGTIYYFASRTGLAWTLVASTAFSITVARRGFRLESQGATTHYYVDWWRSDAA